MKETVEQAVDTQVVPETGKSVVEAVLMPQAIIRTTKVVFMLAMDM